MIIKLLCLCFFFFSCKDSTGYDDSGSSFFELYCEEESIEMWGMYFAKESNSIIINNQNLSGKIPKQIGCFQDLVTLSLSLNNLEGQIPIEIKHLTKLENLYLSYNQLNGEIPDELYDLTSLKILHLNHNEFIGELSIDFQNFSLNRLNVDNNFFTGQIPSNICIINVYSISNNNFCPPYLICNGVPITTENEQDISSCP